MPAFPGAPPPHAPAVPSAHRVRASSVTAMHAAPDRCWWLYLLECGDGTWYAGISNDLPARLQARAVGTGARYTRGRGPLRLLASRAYPDRASASRAEWRLKQLPRRRKLAFFAAGDEG
jgi:putative endonuclease